MSLTYLIPTAKEMKPSTPVTAIPLSNKTQEILATMASLSITELSQAYGISEKAATIEKERWEALSSGTAKSYPALQLFNGLMYRHINKSLITPQSPIYLTSSCYGIIHALAPIAEHRHDFHTKITVNNQSLTHFWRDDYDTFANQHPTIVSLLSSEFNTVFSPEVRQQFLSVTFMEDRAGQLKVHSTISKKARGAFLSAALTQHASTIDDLKQLAFDGFSLDANQSTDSHLIFVKRAV